MNSAQGLLLSREEIMGGYRAVAKVFPHIPPMVMWRGWEYAAYAHFALLEPVLDLGCGDGSFFRLLWPDVKDAVGIDIEEASVAAAGKKGVYRDVRLGAADALPFEAETFNTVFANCSLEHMDNLDGVLQNVARCLRPGGGFLLSVITDNWNRWDTLPSLVELAGDRRLADELRARYIAFHHHMNILSCEEWMGRLGKAGFSVTVRVPIVPEHTARLFLLLDQVWHLSRGAGEAGDILSGHFEQIPDFPDALLEVLGGLVRMETDRSRCSGAVFHAIKGNGNR